MSEWCGGISGFFSDGDDGFRQWDRRDSNWSSFDSNQIIPTIHNRNYRKHLRRRRILQLPQRPPLRQLGQCTVFRCHLLTWDIAREYSAVKRQSISSKAMLLVEETELTSSTTLTYPEHCPSPPDDPGSLRRFHRSVPSRSRCHFYRISMKRTVQSEAVEHWIIGELVKRWTSDAPG